MSSLAIFRKGAGHSDIRKSAQKVADTKKDTVTRLKHLRLVLDNYETQDAKKFFQDNYSHIYYIFYDNFGTVEADLKQRANKAHREELESILYIFEKILFLLPEIIHKRWMFHSIGRIIKKLLHPGNSFQLRRKGVRLFLVWYQCLQENASEECHQIFLHLVPGLGQEDGVELMSFMTDSTTPSDNIGGIIAAGEITAILPSQSEAIPDNITKYFLNNVLTYMVSEVIKIEWMNKEMREQSFEFLFTKFKAKYLHWLLPDFVYRDVYDPVQGSELPTARSKDIMNKKDDPLDVSECRDSFIFWLANFTSHRSSASSMDVPHSGESKYDDSKAGDDDEEEVPTSPPVNPKGNHFSSDATDGDEEAVFGGISGGSHSASEYEIVRAVLYSTRENVNIVHECFRQALLQSFRHTKAIRKVIGVYKEWFQHEEERPVFMLEPAVTVQGSQTLHRDEGDGAKVVDAEARGSQTLHGSLSDIVEEDRNSFDDSPSSSALSLQHLNAPSSGISQDQDNASTSATCGSICGSLSGGAGRSYLRTRSYLGAVGDLADEGQSRDDRDREVRAGLQRILQVFITNAANIFLLDADDDMHLQNQVELCKRVLNIYRHVVMYVEMNQQTWEQMLKVLLRITSGVLKRNPPSERYRTLGGRLAQPIFQTLIVTWTKANLNVLVSTALWDEFLAVLSSLTSWRELIVEWSKTMETLTRVLARQVYGLDLNDLPLERLSEQKEKRRRGKESTKAKPTSLRAAQKLEKSFSRGWSASDSQPSNTLRSSTNSAPSPESLGSFERGNKHNKSDGAGGKVRPDLSKQKSLSGEPSPSHTRCPSTSSECLVRSSSEGNIVADPNDLLEKLRASKPTASPTSSPSTKTREEHLKSEEDSESQRLDPDTSGDVDDPSTADLSDMSNNLDGATAGLAADLEVSNITATCTAELSSRMGPHSVVLRDDDESFEEGLCLDKSEQDDTGKGSRSISPSSVRSKSGSRSPSPSTMLISSDNHKDSPTPDRDSLHIDITGPEDTNVNRGLEVSVDSIDELKSVMAGGKICGWLPDVAVVLWQRMLGCLGDVNKIEDADIHAIVFEALAELLDTLCRMSDNLGVTQDNMLSPPPPELIPPLHFFSAWLFECLSLGNRYKRGKLLAYQLICQSMLRRHEVMPSQSLTSQFYQVLHTGLISSDQDIVNVLVRDCGPKFFSLPLPGCLLLTLDFIKAAGSIISAVDYKEPPRAEAVTVLGSLLCYPHHLQEVPVLEPESMKTVTVQASELKDLVLDLLLKAGKREPAGLARCIAVSSVAIFLYGELTHGTLHPKMKEAINVLLGALMCVNKKVAKVASDMLLLLCDHVDRLLDYHPQMPKKITEAIASTISSLIPSHGATSNSDEEKRLIVAMMFCMVEWCLKMPLPLLLETTDTDKSCVYKVFRVLHSAVTGHSSASLTRVSKSLSDFLLDTDYTNIWENTTGHGTTGSGGASSHTPASQQRPFSADASLAEAITDPGHSLPLPSMETMRKSETDIVKLAARALMSHLVNHMSHFPMGSGAARLHTTVQEHHDLPEYVEEDLRPDIFNAPNVQLFVLNHRCLVSFIELPAVEAPGGGVTAGLTTAKTVCRIVVRDLCGKYCWENSVLYSPPWCTKGSSRLNAKTLLGLATGQRQEKAEDPLQAASSTSLNTSSQRSQQNPAGSTCADELDNMLAYIGKSSPECLLRPGEPLNKSARLPEDLADTVEVALTQLLQQQSEVEQEHCVIHRGDNNMVAPPEIPAESQDPVSPFQMCRMLLDQMGLLSWEKRCHFDLLKKNDKVLRELKNLDAQKCRETHKIAVIYIAQGQEDKNSILSNNSASRAFEDFVAGLGWEIDLETHQGFLGGLQQNRTTGSTAPYWANSTCEVIFHVSTRIPSTGTDWHIKMRHLGNDEVHIVWSEHGRDYRRGIIPTEFGDIVIIIYPMLSGLYRIQICRKPEVPFFGPLFDGAIVDHHLLSGLVRATAVNASRLKRCLMPFYHAFYEERAKNLETIIQQHTEQTMFEDFAENVFAPVLPTNATIVDCNMPSELSSSSLNELLVQSHQQQQQQPSVGGSQASCEQQSLTSQMSPNSSKQRGKFRFPSVASDSALLDGHHGNNNSSSSNTESRFTRTARRFSMKRRSSSSKNSSASVSPAAPTTPPPSSEGHHRASSATSITAFLLPPAQPAGGSETTSPQMRHKSGSGGSTNGQQESPAGRKNSSPNLGSYLAMDENHWALSAASDLGGVVLDFTDSGKNSPRTKPRKSWLDSSPKSKKKSRSSSPKSPKTPKSKK